MINILSKEPIIKKSILLMMISMTVIFSMFAIFQYKNIKNIYLEQETINKKLVGTLANKYPEQEANIVNAIYKQDDSQLDLGIKILDKYGYNENYDMYKNVNFKEHLKYFLRNNLIVFVAIMISVSGIVSIFVNHIYKRLIKVNNDIESMINNNYIIEEDFKEEGLFNRIYSDLNKLSRSLNLKIHDLDREKESIKELVTDISHQLKTPLASLKLYNTLLLEEELDEEDRVEFLKTNDMSINKLHNLIDSLVNISRLEASMINIKREYKSIKQTIQNAINSTIVKANQKNIHINLTNFEDIKISHDSKWTEESIFNVLENAVKYTQESGQVNIEVSQTINFLKIDIEDNGIGIDTSEYNSIFKRFYRSEEVEGVEGSGVGLYLTRKIIEQQGGNIIVSSKKGQGSKFSLFLTKV
ncbi:MAG: sensor histidine kinase [Romboutsia sp.]|uniref:sensor histidine kinase n=1 Tax=Romboutsia sp. TaxID=1965302 RepID=UPI003F41B42D